MAKNKIILHMVNGETLEVTATPELHNSLARLAAGYLPPSTFLKADGFHVNTANILMFEGLIDRPDETQRTGGHVYDAESDQVAAAREAGMLDLKDEGGDMPETEA